MTKLAFITFLTFCSAIAYAQNDFLVFKKKSKPIALFRKDSYIAFQVKSHEWRTGYITRVHNDSFYIKPMVVYYHFIGTDTVYLAVQPFTVADVYTMPKKGVQVDYIKGRFQITKSGGRVNWYWVKSGWIFRVGAAGYTFLNIVNGVIKNNFSFSGSKFGIAAAVFLFGELLHHTHKPALRLGKKYHLQSMKVSD